MEDICLFESAKGAVSKKDVYQTLRSLNAQDCRYLFIHSEISFGMPNPELSKKALLGHIFDAVEALGVENIMVPTFSFSFCNREDFDVQNTRSPMGAFSEYFRKLPKAVRSKDPMMSVSHIGKDREVVEGISNVPCGEGGTFDMLHKKGDVKFLFLGNSISSCMTYSHYVEAMEGVPYRYPRKFTGNVIDNGVSAPAEVFLHVRYNGVLPYADARLDDLLVDGGAAKRAYLGDSFVNVADEACSYKLIADRLKEDPDFMLSAKAAEPFDDTYVFEKKVAL